MIVKVKCGCGVVRKVKVKTMKEAKRVKRGNYIIFDCCIPF